MDGLLLSARDAWREIARHWMSSLVTVCLLGTSIGASGAAFAAAHQVLLTPLPYKEADRLVRLWEVSTQTSYQRSPVSSGTFVDWRQRLRTVELVAGYRVDDWSVRVRGDLNYLRGATISAELLELLGPTPVLGRGFTRVDSRDHEREVLISFRLWQRLFGADPRAIGDNVTMDTLIDKQIVGVLPEDFNFPDGVDIWAGDTAPLEALLEGRRTTWSRDVIARLQPGVSVDDVARELRVVSEELALQYPTSNANWSAAVEPLRESVVGRYAGALWAVWASVSSVCLIALVNLTTLVLVRTDRLRLRHALEQALGASRTRLGVVAVLEQVLVAIGSASIALIIGFASLSLANALGQAGIPRLREVGIQSRLIVALAGWSLLSVLVLSTAAIVAIYRIPMLPVLRAGDHAAGSRQGQAWRRVASVLQIAISVVLATCCLLAVRRVIELRQADLGMSAAGLVFLDVSVPLTKFTPGPRAKLKHYYNNLLGQLSTVPGVQQVAGVSRMPVVDAPEVGYARLNPAAGKDSGRTAVVWHIVTPAFFDTARIPVKAGRRFTEDDSLPDQQLDVGAGRALRTGVVILNETFARLLGGTEAAVGRSIRLAEDTVGTREVVGIVGDLKTSLHSGAPMPEVYVPHNQYPQFGISIVARTAGDASTRPRDLERWLRLHEPDLVVRRSRHMESVIADGRRLPQVTASVLSLFAVVALGLTLVAVGSTEAMNIARRRREIAVRLALGATLVGVKRLLSEETIYTTLAGVLLGIGAAVLGSLWGRETLPATVDGASISLSVLTVVAGILLGHLYVSRRITAVNVVTLLKGDV